VVTLPVNVIALKSRHALAALVQSAGVELHQVGAGRLMGCCPFHDDRTPSFMVDQRDQHFHCFSCGAHGDVIDFLMRREGLDFRRAVDRLEKAPLPPKAVARPGRDRERR
jgi:DNA primase